jgi:hypothetical protein
MEKVVYVVWKDPAQSDTEFRSALIGPVATRLRALGAPRLKVCVVDDEVAPGAGLRIGSMKPPKAGMISFWLEQSQERAAHERAIAEQTARIAGYLVVESRPLVNESQRARPGERTPGFSYVSCIRPRAGLTHEEFIHLWYTVQRDMAIETQSTFSYVRNEIVRPLTPEAPPWAAVVEEGFPIGALDDAMVFYDARGSKEILAAHQKRMLEAVQSFIALDTIECHPMSEYVFEH